MSSSSVCSRLTVGIRWRTPRSGGAALASRDPCSPSGLVAAVCFVSVLLLDSGNAATLL